MGYPFWIERISLSFNRKTRGFGNEIEKIKVLVINKGRFIMICKICGRTVQNEEANFCEYCGASFRPGMDNRVPESERLSDTISNGQGGIGQPSLGQESIAQNGSWQSDHGQSSYGSNSMNGQAMGGYTNNSNPTYCQSNVASNEKPMSVGNWLAVMLLGFVPLIGPYAFLALLFFWSFSKSVPPTKKNWARATLIVALILVVFLSVLIGMTGGDILSNPTAILDSLYAK